MEAIKTKVTIGKDKSVQFTNPNLIPGREAEVIVLMEKEEIDSVTSDNTISNSKPIWEVFDEISKEIPAEEFDKLPPDLAENYKHYLYGIPRRD